MLYMERWVSAISTTEQESKEFTIINADIALAETNLRQVDYNPAAVNRYVTLKFASF